MIYLISNKYYIRVAPMKYTEVEFSIKDNDVVIKPTKNRIESNDGMKIQEINFQKEKEKIKKSLLRRNNESNSDFTRIADTKYRKRR